MMRRYCREQISELPWVHSDQMQQSRQQTLDVGVMVIAVLNAIRALFVKNL